MNLAKMRDEYVDMGLAYESASARACQDAFLLLIARSSFADKVTFKGGVVTQQVSGDKRRATQDIDFDFMRYSISDDSIRAFISKLAKGDADIGIRINGPIEELKHQDYSGKRVHVSIFDKANNIIDTKLDIGVHNNLAPEQRIICFNIAATDEGVSLLANTNEQLVSEKLKSLLRLGARSTRYKDIYDIYYQLCIKGVDRTSLNACMERLVFDEPMMREQGWANVYRRLEAIFGDRRFVKQLANAKNNWLELPADKVTRGILLQVRKIGEGRKPPKKQGRSPR